MIRIVIADDHSIVRQGLRQIVAFESSMDIAGEARNGSEVLELIKNTPVDVVILDLTMPGQNGLETLKIIRRLYPRIGVVVLTMHPKDQYAVRVLKAGASAYISKESASDELVTAIKKANRGEIYVNAEIAEIYANYILRGDEEPHKLLSDREFEVFCMIGSGKAATQIAQELNLSVKTVSTYRTRIIEKTGFASNAEITRYVVDHNL